MELSTQSGVSDEHPQFLHSFAAKSFAVPWVWGRLAMEALKRLSEERGQQGNIQDVPGKNLLLPRVDKQFP